MLASEDTAGFYVYLEGIDCGGTMENVCPGVVGKGFVTRIGLGLITVLATLAAWAKATLF